MKSRVEFLGVFFFFSNAGILKSHTGFKAEGKRAGFLVCVFEEVAMHLDIYKKCGLKPAFSKVVQSTKLASSTLRRALTRGTKTFWTLSIGVYRTIYVLTTRDILGLV